MSASSADISTQLESGVESSQHQDQDHEQQHMQMQSTSTSSLSSLNPTLIEGLPVTLPFPKASKSATRRLIGNSLIRSFDAALVEYKANAQAAIEAQIQKIQKEIEARKSLLSRHASIEQSMVNHRELQIQAAKMAGEWLEKEKQQDAEEEKRQLGKQAKKGVTRSSASITAENSSTRCEDEKESEEKATN